ncbi:MAG: hypothetical protein ACC652_11900 [Acidimicrobiales bacterium]
MGLLGNIVWHAWIAFPLFIGAVLAIVGTGVGYYIKVVAPQYPPRK